MINPLPEQMHYLPPTPQKHLKIGSPRIVLEIKAAILPHDWGYILGYIGIMESQPSFRPSNRIGAAPKFSRSRLSSSTSASRCNSFPALSDANVSTMISQALQELSYKACSSTGTSWLQNTSHSDVEVFTD